MDRVLMGPEFRALLRAGRSPANSAKITRYITASINKQDKDEDRDELDEDQDELDEESPENVKKEKQLEELLVKVSCNINLASS